ADAGGNLLATVSYPDGNPSVNVAQFAHDAISPFVNGGCGGSRGVFVTPASERQPHLHRSRPQGECNGQRQWLVVNAGQQVVAQRWASEKAVDWWAGIPAVGDIVTAGC